MRLIFESIHKGIILQTRNTAKGIFLSTGFRKKPPGAIV